VKEEGGWEGKWEERERIVWAAEGKDPESERG